MGKKNKGKNTNSTASPSKKKTNQTSSNIGNKSSSKSVSSTSNNNNNETPSEFLWTFAFAIFVALAGIAMTMQGTIESITGPTSKFKPYSTVNEFWPHYVNEHQNPICQITHFIGTSIVILIWLFEPKAMLSSLIGGLAAYIAFPALRGLDNGIYEAIVFFIFATFFARQFGVLKYLFLTAIVGYGFAWVGHFIFEQNRPATFIYPSYSLICDFRLLFSIYKQLFATQFDVQSLVEQGLDMQYLIN